MPANSLGHLFSITTFGESHGAALGCVVDGCPSNIPFDEALMRRWMERRRPGSHALVSARSEEDRVEVVSGVFEGKTLGTPIAMIVRNKDARSQDYTGIKHDPRPGHADDLWRDKFGHIDWRGGGRASGRETVARVMGGAVAQMVVQQSQPNLTIESLITRIGPLELEPAERRKPLQSERVQELLSSAKEEGESFGGIAELRFNGVPRGLGEPVFHKFKSDLARGFMSVGATSGIEFGAGFAAAAAKGSEFHHHERTSQYGGIRGGITTGEEIVCRVAFKPTSSIRNIAQQGRHDPCIVPRAAVVLEAMAWLVVADHLIWRRMDQV